MSLPRFAPGDAITAQSLNLISAAAEKAFNRPRPVPDTPPDEDNDDDTPVDVLYIEAGTSTETVRIEDPDDSDTYVNVQRRVVETFQDSNGRFHRFVRSY